MCNCAYGTLGPLELGREGETVVTWRNFLGFFLLKLASCMYVCISIFLLTCSIVLSSSLSLFSLSLSLSAIVFSLFFLARRIKKEENEPKIGGGAFASLSHLFCRLLRYFPWSFSLKRPPTFRDYLDLIFFSFPSSVWYNMTRRRRWADRLISITKASNIL